MPWQFIATDLNGGVIGEVTQADERKVVLPHMRVPSASFKIPLWHSLADTILSTDTLLKCYRQDPLTGTRSLAFNGPVVSVEEAAEGNTQTLAVTAAGPYWRVARRFIGTSEAVAPAKPPGIAWPSQDLGLTAHAILDTINGQGFTGISKGTRTASINGVYGPVWLKNAAEAIAELSAPLNSFEMVVDPTEPTSVGGVGGWPQIGLMRLAPIIGSVKPDAIFEYGTGSKNVAGYNRKVDREGLANRAWISVNGWPDTPEQNKDLLVRNDTGSQTARGLFEAVVPDNGVIDDALRNGIADFHLAYRKNPRTQITFKPATNARPAPLIDYNAGDTVRARAMVRGILRFDVLFRIWGISFDVDANGNENVELELVIP